MFVWSLFWKKTSSLLAFTGPEVPGTLWRAYSITECQEHCLPVGASGSKHSRRRPLTEPGSAAAAFPSTSSPQTSWRAALMVLSCGWQTSLMPGQEAWGEGGMIFKTTRDSSEKKKRKQKHVNAGFLTLHPGPILPVHLAQCCLSASPWMEQNKTKAHKTSLGAKRLREEHTQVDNGWHLALLCCHCFANYEHIMRS